MKATLKTLVLMGLILTTQTTLAASDWTLAPTVGANSFKLSGSELDSRSGILAGAQILYATGIQGLKLETGINYLEAGAKTDAFFASAEIALGYVAIPVIANWAFYQTSGGTELYAKAGAYVSYLMSAKQKTQVFGATDETDIKETMNSTDVLATVGFGGRWKVFGDMQVSADVNYAKGMMNVVKAGDGKSEGFIIATSLMIPL